MDAKKMNVLLDRAIWQSLGFHVEKLEGVIHPIMQTSGGCLFFMAAFSIKIPCSSIFPVVTTVRSLLKTS